jgi:tetratricopeptide (TPR) repeat protein
MTESSDDRRVVSISALVAAMRREYLGDPTIGRVLMATLGVDEAAARDLVAGRAPAPAADPADVYALLDAAQTRRDWPEVVALIGRIVEEERDAKRRARYFYSAALIQRDELADPGAALESLEQALDSDPSLLAAFERQTAMLTQQQDWKRLERAHRKMIVRIRGQGEAALESRLWEALALIYRDRLGDSVAAVACFQQALNGRPEDAAILAALQALGA